MSEAEKIFEIIKTIGFLLPGLESKHQYLRRLKRATYYGTLNRLEKKGFIKKQKQGRSMKVVLTEKGKRFSFSSKFISRRRKDGLSTIIIFDIPESFRKQRQYFRRKLVQNGFVLIQKSVLISPNEYPNELLELESELGIAKYVSHLSGRTEYLHAKRLVQ